MAAAVLSLPWRKGPWSREALEERCPCVINSCPGNDGLLLVINQGITSTWNAGVNWFGFFGFFFLKQSLSYYCTVRK